MTRPLATSRAGVMIVFDWNGTVVLDADRALRALNAVLAGHGVPQVDAAGFRSSFRLPMSAMFDDLGLPAALGAAAEAEWNAHMARTTTVLRPGTDEVLRELALAGVWLGVVSAAAYDSVDFDLHTLRVPDVWHAVHAPTRDKEATLAALRYHAEAAYYVGDTAYDMECARSAGYVPVGVTEGYADVRTLLAAGADVVIERMEELLPLSARHRLPISERTE